MEFVYHTFEHQGGTDGSAEIVAYMTEKYPDLFDTYVASSDNVLCKIDSVTALTLSNSFSSGAGFAGAGVSLSFGVSNQAKYAKLIADEDTRTLVFLSGGGDYPILTLCKNEDGDTCAVSFAIVGNNSILMGTSGTINIVQTSDVYVMNFIKQTSVKIPCGFARTEQNVACGFPLVDADGRKIPNVWVGGASALRNFSNPIEIIVDNERYCCIKYGWLLIK